MVLQEEMVKRYARTFVSIAVIDGSFAIIELIFP